MTHSRPVEYKLHIVFKRTPKLRKLRLGDVESKIIEHILTILPELQSLDTSFLIDGDVLLKAQQPIAHLKDLIVRVHSMPPKFLWAWIARLVPHGGELERLVVQNAPVPPSFLSRLSDTTVPPFFLRKLDVLHGSSLRNLQFYTYQLAPDDFQFLCVSFVKLEALLCAVVGQDLVGRRLSENRMTYAYV